MQQEAPRTPENLLVRSDLKQTCRTETFLRIRFIPPWPKMVKKQILREKRSKSLTTVVETDSLEGRYPDLLQAGEEWLQEQ